METQSVIIIIATLVANALYLNFGSSKHKNGSSTPKQPRR